MNMEDTWSVCPVCLKRVAARYEERQGHVYMLKNCQEHGEFQTIVWRNGPPLSSYIREPINTAPSVRHTGGRLGCPYDCGLCEEHEQAACCVVVNVTEACNLRCPVCLADSGEEKTEPPLNALLERFDALSRECVDRPYNIQLSGGEPTVREDLPELIKCVKEKGFPYVQVNTNGIRLAEARDYAAALKAAGLDCVFLQFDGVDDGVYGKIRGRSLLSVKERAIENCRLAGLSVVLVMTVVPGINAAAVGDVIKFAADRVPYVRGIHFQPVSYIGRYMHTPKDEDRFTMGDLLHAIEAQTDGAMKMDDFVPLLSGHSLCSFHGNFVVKEKGAFEALSMQETSCCCCNKSAIVRSREYVAKKWSGATSDGEYADEWEAFQKQTDERSFSITTMGFMDAWNLDLKRLKKCRLQAMTQDGRLIPLCAYNLTAMNGERLYGRL
ncbi:radical SAM protein [Christensenellaceae bacterium OttesenSCG-928-M15]|nr:radical SAM protein [Christensenellaceae bacterium OttesenSCG-928-M15]